MGNRLTTKSIKKKIGLCGHLMYFFPNHFVILKYSEMLQEGHISDSKTGIKQIVVITP